MFEFEDFLLKTALFLMALGIVGGILFLSAPDAHFLYLKMLLDIYFVVGCFVFALTKIRRKAHGFGRG